MKLLDTEIVDRKDLLLNTRELAEKFQDLESEIREVKLPKTQRVKILGKPAEEGLDSQVSRTRAAFQMMSANKTVWKKPLGVRKIESIGISSG